MKLLAKRINLFAAVAVFTLAAASTTLAQTEEDSAKELRKIQQEFNAVKSQLEAIKDEAMETETVQKAYAHEEEVLKSELLSEAPDKTQTIEEYFDARAAFVEAYQSSDKDSIKTAQTKVETLSTEIQGDLQKVESSEPVAAAEQATRDAIIAAMFEVNPKTRELLEEQNRLYQRYQQLTKRG